MEDGERLVDVFDLNDFKAYFINIWKYFSNYIGFFDVDRYCNGVLYIPLPHHAGTSDYEITIDEFDEEFLRFCEQYQEYECF